MWVLLIIILVPLIAYPIHLYWVRRVVFRYSPKYVYYVYPISLTSNTLMLTMLIIAFYQTIHDSQMKGLWIVWRCIYWVNFSFGFILFPILAEREKNIYSNGNFRLLLQFYLRRVIIIGSIAIVSLGIICPVARIPFSKLFEWNTLWMLPVLIVTIFGFFLIVLHFSLAFNNIPKTLIRKLSPRHELSKILVFCDFFGISEGVMILGK